MCLVRNADAIVAIIKTPYMGIEASALLMRASSKSLTSWPRDSRFSAFSHNEPQLAYSHISQI